MVPAPIITASATDRRPIRRSVSVLDPIGPERPPMVARPSTVRAKFVITYGRSASARSRKSRVASWPSIVVGPGSGRSRRTSATVLDLAQVLDIGAILLVRARSVLEPCVEDLLELGLGGCPETEGQDIGVVPASRTGRGPGVAAQRGADPRNLVRRDRRSGSSPATDHGLFGTAGDHVPCSRLTRPRPPVALGLGEGAMRDRIVTPASKLVHESLGDAGPLVGCHGDPHAWKLTVGSQSGRTGSPTAVSPPRTTAARRPPRCTNPFRTPGRVSPSRCRQGSHSSMPAHSTSPTANLLPTSSLTSTPRVRRLRLDSAAERSMPV